MEGSKFHDYQWRRTFQPDFESRQTLLRQAVRDRTVSEGIGSRDEEKVVVTSARKNAKIDVPSTSSRPIGDMTCSVRHIDIGLYHFKSDFEVSTCQYKYHRIESQVFDSTCQRSMVARRTGQPRQRYGTPEGTKLRRSGVL